MDIRLDVTIDEVSEILNGLSERPYKLVAGLIQKVQHIANSQIAENAVLSQTPASAVQPKPVQPTKARKAPEEKS